jgi:hypothetical protein
MAYSSRFFRRAESVFGLMPRSEVSRSWKRRDGCVRSSRKMRIVQRSPTMSSVRATGQGSVLFEVVTIGIIVTTRALGNIWEFEHAHCGEGVGRIFQVETTLRISFSPWPDGYIMTSDRARKRP